jgi:oxepin-CoA hydrolase/3-oxo-5,6-dehydrosuberyl-CoA semialdehyde dehydrogenase
VHINAFNFPGWGLCEKLACAVLAGMPVLAKPATATALVAHRLVQLFAPVLPPGVLQLLVGPAGALLVGRTDARPVTTLAQPWS